MTTCNIICTYNRTIYGTGNDQIKKFSSSGLSNFHVLFDLKEQEDFTQKFLEDKYESKICIYGDKDFIYHNLNKPISKNHRWGCHQNPKYFYAHYRMLIFYLNNPEYNYYWFFDDDVDFKGDINQFLNRYETESDDFIAIQAFKKDQYEEFPRISCIKEPGQIIEHSWFSSCPGDGDVFKSQNRLIGSFFPIVRFSNRSMKHLWNLHKDGFYGYSEGFVPTSLGCDGFKVSSMMDKNNNFFIENDTACELLHQNIPFTWSWLRLI